MKATMEKLDKSKVALHIDVEEAEWAAAIAKAFRTVGQKVTVPGFRKGHAPRPILERYVGIDYITSDAIEHMFPAVYKQAVSETGIEPIDEPDIDSLDIADDNKSVKLKVQVAVKPEVLVKEYKGLAAERLIKKVTDDDVADVLNQMREEQAQLVTADHDTVQNGDFAVIDFEGFIDGKPFQGGTANNHLLEIGSGQFIPGFEDQLIGTGLDEEKIIKTTFPENYHASELAGKEAEFKVVVHELKIKRLPAIDDDFAKDLGEFDTLADLRNRVRENLEKTVAARAEDQVRQDLINAATNKAELEVPDILINREVDQRLLSYVQRLAMQGIDPSPLRGKIEELRKQLVPAAEIAVRQDLVLEAIAKAEGISVSPDEIETEIERIITDDTAHAEEIRQQFADSDRRSRLEQVIRIQKAVDLLVSNAMITQREIDSAATDEPAAQGEAEAN